MQLTLCISKNQSLLKKFPKDPDHDFTIRCHQSTFKLQLAFLYLESSYFDRIDPSLHPTLQLHQYDQDALHSVLSVLYGGEVKIQSFEKLSRVYQVVEFLEIESLKEGIKEQLEEIIKKVNLVQMLEFGMRYGVLQEKIIGMVMENDLEILRDPMFSIELNKLSSKHLNTVLLRYLSSPLPIPSQTTQQQQKLYISDILSDYFHINKIKPQQYFQDPKIVPLKSIWFETHPVFVAETLYDSQGLEEESEIKISELMAEVRELQEMIGKYDERILRLEEENAGLRERELREMGGGIWREGEEETRVGKLNSPFRMGGIDIPGNQREKEKEKGKGVNVVSYEVPEDDMGFGRRINQTSGAKFLQTVKDNNRNNSRNNSARGERNGSHAKR